MGDKVARCEDGTDGCERNERWGTLRPIGGRGATLQTDACINRPSPTERMYNQHVTISTLLMRK